MVLPRSRREVTMKTAFLANLSRVIDDWDECINAFCALQHQGLRGIKAAITRPDVAKLIALYVDACASRAEILEERFGDVNGSGHLTRKEQERIRKTSGLNYETFFQAFNDGLRDSVQVWWLYFNFFHPKNRP
jgi:hypothetical protein